MHEVSVDLLNQEMQRLFKEYVFLLEDSSGHIVLLGDDSGETDFIGFDEVLLLTRESAKECFFSLEESRSDEVDNINMLVALSPSIDSICVFITNIREGLKDIVKDLNDKIECSDNEIEEINSDIKAIGYGFEGFKKKLNKPLNELIERTDSVIKSTYELSLNIFNEIIIKFKEESDGARSFNSLATRDIAFKSIGFDCDSINIIAYNEADVKSDLLNIKSAIEAVFEYFETLLNKEINESLYIFDDEFSGFFNSFSNEIIRANYSSDFRLDSLDIMLNNYKEVNSQILNDSDSLFYNLSVSKGVRNYAIGISKGIFSGLFGVNHNEKLEVRNKNEDLSAFNEYFIIDIEKLRNDFSHSLVNYLDTVKKIIREEPVRQIKDFITESFEVFQTDVYGLTDERLELLEENENNFEVKNKLSLLEKNIHYFIDDFKHLKNDINKLQEESGVAQ